MTYQDHQDKVTKIKALDSCKIEDQEKNLIELTDDFKNIIENVLVVQPNHGVFEIKY